MTCPPEIMPYIQLSAAGIVGLSFLLVIKWMMTSLSYALWANTITILDMHKSLIRHDAQIRGVNPTAGDDETDAHNKARQEYVAILETLTTTTQLLQERIRPTRSKFSIFG